MLRKALLTIAVWLLVINAFALIGWNRFNVVQDTAYPWIDAHHLHTPAWSLTGLWARWDSEWYFDIVRNGYVWKGPNTLSNIVFFPLYPFLIRLVSLVFGSLVLSGWLVSIASLCGAVFVFQRFLKKFHPKVDADDAVLALLLFPTAIFFNAVYTESLFLLVSLLTVMFIREKRYGLAGVFGILASLTRVTGVLLIVLALIEFVQDVGWKHVLQKQLLPILAMPLGLVGFFVYHWMAFGSPTLFFAVEKTWGRGFSLNAEHFKFITASAASNGLLDLGFFVFGLGMVVYLWRRVRVSYAVYSLLTMLVAVSTGTLMSIGRYELVLFPFAIGVATWKPSVRRWYFMVAAMVLALYAILFAQSYWAG